MTQTRPTTLDEFEATLHDHAPPSDLRPEQAALWWGHRASWDLAHRLVQDEPGPDAAWVHAWLHRVEGDTSNAAYWYHRAGQAMATGSSSREWAAIATALLARPQP